MTKTAIMADSLATRIWKTKKDDLYIKYQKELLRYMEKLSMIAKATIVSEDGQEEEELPIYFIPCLLKTAPDESFISCLKRKDSTCSPVLCFAFEKNFLPPSVFHRLLAACIAKWPVSRQGRKFLIFCGCGIFDISTGTSRHRLTVLHLGDVIAIKISLLSSTMKYLDGRLCDQARRFVDSTLNNEFKRFTSHTGRKNTRSNNSVYGIEEEEKIPPFKCRILCPDIQDICLASENEVLIDVEELLAAHEEGLYSCIEHSDRQDPHIIDTRDVLRDWFPDKVGSGCSPFVTMCKRLEDLKEQEHEKPLSDLLMCRIARCIGRGWEGLGIELGLSSTDIDNVKEDFPQSMYNRIYQVMKIWSAKVRKGGDFRKLNECD